MADQFTPVAPAKYVWLNKPSTKWKKEDGEYKCSLVFSPDDPFIAEVEGEAKAGFEVEKSKWDEEVAAMAPRARAQAQPLMYHDPITDELDEAHEPTGNLMVNFKCPGAYIDRKTKQKKVVTLRCYDAKGKPIATPPNVGTGSELVIQYRPNGKVIKGTFYYTMYINAYQIVKLVEFGGGDGGGFKAQEGGYVASNVPETTGSSEADGSDF